MVPQSSNKKIDSIENKSHKAHIGHLPVAPQLLELHEFFIPPLKVLPDFISSSKSKGSQYSNGMNFSLKVQLFCFIHYQSISAFDLSYLCLDILENTYPSACKCVQGNLELTWFVHIQN